jgi:excinuclease UvrABC ATPase subunit
VSSLKRSHFVASAGGDDITKGLGIENGTFKWNEVEQEDDNTAKTTESVSSASTDNIMQETDDETERTSISASESSEHRFELRDINVMFPERQLTVITGPTASGKTALLVSWKTRPLQISSVTFIYVSPDGSTG